MITITLQHYCFKSHMLKLSLQAFKANLKLNFWVLDRIKSENINSLYVV